MQIKSSEKNLCLTPKRIVHWLHCLYDPNTLDDFYTAHNLFKKLIPDVEFNVVLINNGNGIVTSKNDDFRIISGTNSSREFSAWAEGWGVISPIVDQNDIFIISNDTLNKHHDFNKFLAYFFALKYRLELKNFFRRSPYVIGVAERFEFLAGITCYVPTFFCLMNFSAAVSTLPYIALNCVECKPNMEYKENGMLLFGDNSKYVTFIQNWLTGSGRLKWYGARAYTSDNFNFLISKAQAILLEHAFAKRIYCSGGQIESCFKFGSLLGKVFRVMYVLRQKYRSY
jgi:hypothetical protein